MAGAVADLWHRDADLRADVGRLLRRVAASDGLDGLDGRAGVVLTEAEGTQQPPPLPAGPEAPAEPTREVPLSLGGARVHVRAQGTQAEVERAARSRPAFAELSPRPGPTSAHAPAETTDKFERYGGFEGFDADLVRGRCELKARAVRWQLERDHVPADERRRRDAAVIEEGRALPNAFLWMCQPGLLDRLPADEVEQLAGCFDALAAAAELVGPFDPADDADWPDVADVRRLAEAQSMLRLAAVRADDGRNDPDQIAAFIAAREFGRRAEHYLDHLSLSDPADPAGHAAFTKTVRAILAKRHAAGRDERRRAEGFEKFGRAASKLAMFQRVVPADDRDLRRLAAAARELTEAGVPPSDKRFREPLGDLLDRLPELPATESFAPLVRVVGAVSEHLDAQAAQAEEPEPSEVPPSPQDEALAAEVRRLVGGRHAVLIGGQPVEVHRRRLEERLGLASLNWIRVEHHHSFDAAERELRRAEVSLAIVMTRFRSHRDGPAARAVCKDRGIPLVELRAGFNWRRAAADIAEQLGGRSVAG